VLDSLIAYGGQVPAGDETGATPLLAAQYGFEGAAIRLLEVGGDPITTGRGQSVIDLAEDLRRNRFIEALKVAWPDVYLDCWFDSQASPGAA
jgi:hypothetical protein